VSAARRKRNRRRPVEVKMPRLIDAVLTRHVERDDERIRGIEYRVMPHEALAVAVPSLFTLWVVFRFESEPGTVFRAEVEVLQHMGRPIVFDSGGVQTPRGGRGEVPIELPITVQDAGPMLVFLSLDGRRVWEQTVFFARQAG